MTDRKKWWVFFTGTATDGAWWYRLNPVYCGPFKHCYACCEITDSFHMWIDPEHNGLTIELMRGDPAEHAAVVHRAGGRVLTVEFALPRYDLMKRERFNRRGLIITCASVIGYALGLDSRAITPRGLWRDLVTRYRASEVLDGRKPRRRGQFGIERAPETGTRGRAGREGTAGSRS